MHLGVFLIQSASFVHVVCRCASLSTTFALSQSMTWFSSTAWSVMADLRVTLLSLALEARVCVPAVKVHFFLVFLDLQTELPACLSNIRAGAVLARDTIDQFGLLFILNLVLWMNHKVPLVTHKSAITDHAVEENHVIDWDKAKVVDREAQRQTRWIKEAL